MTGYQEWAQHHCSVFGLLSPAEVRMVGSWQEVFDARNCTAEELRAATNYLAGHAPPAAHNGEAHLRALNARIAAVRRSIDNEREKDDERPVCTRCGNTGRVIVPHVKCVQAGEWVAKPFRYTMAVACTCIAGMDGNRVRFTVTEDGKTFRLPTIVEYELKNPNWRSQVRQQERVAKAMARAVTDPQVFSSVGEVKQAIGRMP